MFKKRFSWNLLLIFFVLVGSVIYGAEETPRKKLSQAISKGDLLQVQSLIESKAVGHNDVPEYDYEGVTPLVEAAANAQMPIMKYLLEQGSSIEGLGEKKSTPLTRLIEKAASKLSSEQMIEMVRFLIEAGADVNGPGKDGYTPLMNACKYTRHVELMKLLLDLGAQINAKASDKSTSLTLLIENAGPKWSCEQMIEMVRFFIEAGANINSPGKGGYTPLMNVCKYTRCIQLMELLLDAGAMINDKADDGNTPFILSIRSGSVKAFQFLIERGADTSVSCKGLSPLGVAAFEGHVVMAQLIIDELKADVNKYDDLGGTPVCWAAVSGEASMISFLVEQGADINAKTKNAVDVEKPKPRDFLQLGKTYVTFPKNSTALNFANWTGLLPTINLISDLGGIEFEHFELKETTDYRLGRYYR